MTNLIATDASTQELGTLLYFYDIEISSSVTLRYHSGLFTSLATVTWYDYNSPYNQVSYSAMPIKGLGQHRTSMGSPERPSLSIGILATTFSSDLASANIYNFGDLLGKKVTIRTTLEKYITGGSLDSGSGSAPIEFPKVTFLIESIAQLDRETIVYELTSPFDTQGITIPHRKATANLCSWIYKGANIANVGSEYSACYWPVEGSWNIESGGVLIDCSVYFNAEDEPVIGSDVTFTTYSSGAITKNTLYKTVTSEVRINADGSTSTVNVNNYWQARLDSSSPGTPSSTNASFRRVRVYQTYSSSATYYVYKDTQHNDYVRATDGSNKIWKAGTTIQGESPGFNAFWSNGDVCGKKLNSCAVRYGFKRVGSTSGTTVVPDIDTDTTSILPFGGFPGLAKKLMR